MAERPVSDVLLESSVKHLGTSTDIAYVQVVDDSDSDSDDEDELPAPKIRIQPTLEGPEEDDLDHVYLNVSRQRHPSFNLSKAPMERLDPRVLQCNWVTSLTLEDNQLRHLPEDIATFTQLQSLKVKNNRLTTLPAAIGQLAKLETLDFANNSLVALPREMANLVNLRTLILDFNKLTEIPAPVAELRDLKVLSLMENHGIRTFAPVDRLKRFKQLTLHIDNVPRLETEWQRLHYPNITMEWNKIFPDRVLDFLFIGSLRTAQYQRVYDDLRIKRILTCGANMAVNVGPGMDQLLLNLNDTVDSTLDGHLEKGMDYIADARAKNEPVLVHCFAGLSRSASLIIAFLMRENRWTFQRALDFVKVARPNAQPNDGFVRQLMMYEKQLGL